MGLLTSCLLAYLHIRATQRAARCAASTLLSLVGGATVAALLACAACCRALASCRVLALNSRSATRRRS